MVMSNPKDEPAFPQSIAVGPAGDVYGGESAGMSLRDYFAGQLLPTLAEEKIIRAHEDDPARKATARKIIASECYAMADAMLARRAALARGEQP